MSIFLPNGIGAGTTGDSLSAARPLQTSGNVWYVNTLGGVDAVSPAGLNATKPLATLAQAITNAADHDIIAVVFAQSALTSAVTVNKAVTIVGCVGAGEESQASYWRTGGAAVNLLNITAAGVQLRNILFPATETPAVATARIAVSGARFKMIGCAFESADYDTGPIVSLDSGADSCEIRNCTFTSTATATPPESCIKSSAALTELRILRSTFSGGATGFSNFYAVDLSSAAVTRAEIENCSLLMGADMKLHASSTGWVNIELATGGSRVDW